jgi:3-dehydroquinate synthase
MFEKFSVKSSVRESYAVIFIENLDKCLFEIEDNGNALFIIDSNVELLYEISKKKPLENGKIVQVICTEQNKTIQYIKEVLRDLISKGIRKDSVLIAIGGGIIQDIVAFISSILYRGVEWKFIPTTLLAQCDSCIGSKSSINFDLYKNLLGTFSPPSEIFIYKRFLDSLSESEIKSGIGEMLHYFFTEGIDLAQGISDNYELLLIDRSALSFYISNSLRIKKQIIELDEFDQSIRHIFNYGHTFGHALEAITNYSIPHGQAISIGMDLAKYISLHRGMLAVEDFDKMHEILQKNTPPFKIDTSNIELYCSALSRDKKNKGNLLGCILSRGAGKVEKGFVQIDQTLKELIIQYFLKYA